MICSFHLNTLRKLALHRVHPCRLCWLMFVAPNQPPVGSRRDARFYWLVYSQKHKRRSENGAGSH